MPRRLAGPRRTRQADRALGHDGADASQQRGRPIAPQFADSDYEHGRGPQGDRKKSWLSNIFD
jgi:hypothetical protein